MRKRKILTNKLVSICLSVIVAFAACFPVKVAMPEVEVATEAEEETIESDVEESHALNAGFSYAMDTFDYDNLEVTVEEVPDTPMVTEMYCESEDCMKEDPLKDMTLVSSTGYYDAYGYGYGALGPDYPLIQGLTVAGKREWLGKTVAIYYANEDGTLGDFVGYYEFRDTGYGQSTGWGSSSILKGRSVGTIEAGLCIDIYFTTRQQCVEWGRRNVYIKIIDAKG